MKNKNKELLENWEGMIMVIEMVIDRSLCNVGDGFSFRDISIAGRDIYTASDLRAFIRSLLEAQEKQLTEKYAELFDKVIKLAEREGKSAVTLTLLKNLKP